MTETNTFAFEYIEQHQTGKETLLNTNFEKLDKFLWGGVKSMTVTSDPSTPWDGDMYIVPVGAGGQWTGKDNDVAVFDQNYGWLFISPKQGTLMYCNDKASLFVFSGSSWSLLVAQ